jgi:uncharacterized protein with gpF-like domain
MDAIGVYLLVVSPTIWQRQFTGPMADLMTERVDYLNKRFNQQYPAANLLRQEWFNEYTIQFAQPINATTEDSIRRLINQGVIDGWSVPTVQKRLGLMFDRWMTGKLTAQEFEWLAGRLPEYRREMIARTETMKALNTISFKLYGAWGVDEHEWLSAHDNRTRLDHREADGQVVIVGTPFLVGGEQLLYPGDPKGSAGNVINCRCCTVPRV